MTVQESAEQEIVAEWQPCVADRKRLVRNIVLQQIKQYLPALCVPAIFAAGFDKLLHVIKQMSFLPEWWFLIGFCTVQTMLYIAESRRLIRRSTARLSNVAGMSINQTRLKLHLTSGEMIEYESRRPHDHKGSLDGIYFTLDNGRMYIPIRAFATAADMDAVEKIFVHYASIPRVVFRSPPPETGVFPVSIAFQQTNADIVYAYYHGWAPSYLRSTEGTNALKIVLAPLVLCTILALATGAPLGVLVFPLMITAALGAIVIPHTISPAFPLSVAQRRHSFKKPITIALGVKGVAVREGDKKEVVAWSAVRKIAIEKRYLCIDMPDDLILIPRAVFLDDNHADEFFAAAKAYQRGEIPMVDGVLSAWPPAPDNVKIQGATGI